MSMLDVKDKEPEKVKDLNGNGIVIVAVTCADIPKESRPTNWEGLKKVHDEADKLFIKRIELYIKVLSNHPEYRLKYERNSNGAVIAAIIEKSEIVQMVTRSGYLNIFRPGLRILLRKNGGEKLGIK